VSGTHDRTKRTQQWILQRWPAIRAQGFARFLLLRGLLTWGGVMFALIAIMTVATLGTDHPRLPMLLGLGAALCAVGGLFWGAMTWWINERLYRATTAGRGG
jgi:hypothetical protein